MRLDSFIHKLWIKKKDILKDLNCDLAKKQDQVKLKIGSQDKMFIKKTMFGHFCTSRN